MLSWFLKDHAHPFTSHSVPLLHVVNCMYSQVIIMFVFHSESMEGLNFKMEYEPCKGQRESHIRTSYSIITDPSNSLIKMKMTQLRSWAKFQKKQWCKELQLFRRIFSPNTKYSNSNVSSMLKISGYRWIVYSNYFCIFYF